MKAWLAHAQQLAYPEPKFSLEVQPAMEAWMAHAQHRFNILLN